jgi:hypothetical protein
VVRPASARSPHRFDPVTLVTLLCGGAALACTFFPALHGPGITLAAAGLLAGLAGVAGFASRRTLAALAAVVPGGVLLVMTAPGLLGFGIRGRDRGDSTEMIAMPLMGRSGVDVKLPTQWVDASATALERSGVRIQVVKASVQRGTGIGTGTLQLYLRVWNFSRKRPSENGARGRPLVELPSQCILIDEAGVVYASRRDNSAADDASARDFSSGAIPYIDRSVFFDAINAGSPSFRLQLATSTEDRNPYQFTIPAHMYRPADQLEPVAPIPDEADPPAPREP